MTPYTHRRLTDTHDVGPDIGLAAGHEVRFATEDMGTEGVGLTHHRLEPGGFWP